MNITILYIIIALLSTFIVILTILYRKEKKASCIDKQKLYFYNIALSQDDFTSKLNSSAYGIAKRLNISECTFINKKNEIVASTIVDFQEQIKLQNTVSTIDKSKVQILFNEDHPLDYAQNRSVHYFMYLPLINESDYVGGLIIENDKPLKPNHEKTIFDTLIPSCQIFAFTLYSSGLYLSANRDALTGASNRTALSKLTLDTNSNYTFAMADIDFFKKINDSYGHDAGDYCLKQFVANVSKHLRPSDYLFRLGGEEFLIIFKDTLSGPVKNFV